MALATADARGRPSVRMVLLKDVDARGFAFYTNVESRKARDLAARPVAALCFHWPLTDVQVRVEGTVVPVADDEADAYFATRPRGSQISAWASRQSATLASRDVLLERVARIERRFAGAKVPRPPHWSGYRVVPRSIEFWESRADRLHERLLYVRARGGWRVRALQP
jgi:pyridoxamine 5'-phosphate oxidase